MEWESGRGKKGRVELETSDPKRESRTYEEREMKYTADDLMEIV